MIAIREVTLSDYSTLKNVVDTCSEQSEYINKLDEEFAKDVVTKPFNTGEAGFFIAYVDNIPAGYALLVKYRQELYIANLAVLKRFHGQGIAKELLDFSKRTAKEHSFTSLSLNVEATNKRAVSVYKKAGFVRKDQFTVITMTTSVESVQNNGLTETNKCFKW